MDSFSGPHTLPIGCLRTRGCSMRLYHVTSSASLPRCTRLKVVKSATRTETVLTIAVSPSIALHAHGLLANSQYTTPTLHVTITRWLRRAQPQLSLNIVNDRRACTQTVPVLRSFRTVEWKRNGKLFMTAPAVLLVPKHHSRRCSVHSIQGCHTMLSFIPRQCQTSH